MLNTLHSLLINRPVPDEPRIAGFDIIDVPEVKNRYDVVEQLAGQLLGDTVQDQHYWACRVRQLVRRSGLREYVGFQQLEGGHQLDDISADLVLSQRPQLISAAGSRLVVERFGELVDTTYVLHRFDLSVANQLVSTFRPDGSLAAEAVAVNGMANLSLFGQTGCRIPIEHLPGRLEWATRLSLSTAARYVARYAELTGWLVHTVELPSCYDLQAKQQLLDTAGLLAFADTAFAAAALLVAGHTAWLYGQTLR